MNHPPTSAPDHNQPIGVFDSGVGGLTVVRAIRNLLPNESISYIGDTARVPYGSKSPTTVQRYALEIGSMLAAEPCKAVVVACNTASSVALEVLRAEVNVPVIGVIEPGARAAVTATRTGRIGVIGTRATIKSGAYERAIRALRPDVEVISRACPLLVPLIEEGRLDGSVTDTVIRDYVAPMLESGIDTIVLGCTHYPLLRDAIQRVVGQQVTLVDSAENCAAAIRDLLADSSCANTGVAAATLRVALTDMPDHFLRVAEEALQLDIGEPRITDVTPRAPR